MQTLKIVIGIIALGLAWALIFKTKLIFNINAWMREYVFSDKVVLFSGKRAAFLLLVLGVVALFSGVGGIVDEKRIQSNIATQMIEQAQLDFKTGAYPHVVTRCKELVRSHPKNVEAWELLASAWWAMGKKQLAVQAVESLVRVKPDYPLDKGPLKNILAGKKSGKIER